MITILINNHLHTAQPDSPQTVVELLNLLTHGGTAIERNFRPDKLANASDSQILIFRA